MVFRERELLERFRAGEAEALETVYWACIDHVSRIASAVLRACAAGGARGGHELTTALADVVQEVFTKAFAPEARRGFDASRPYEPYLAQITRNVAVDHWRQARRYVPADIDYLIEKLSVEAESQGEPDHWADAETAALVNRYLASLDDESRRVHDALYVRGMSQRQAAEFLGLGRQVVRTKEAKLRDGLRRHLSRAAPAQTIAMRSVAGKANG